MDHVFYLVFSITVLCIDCPEIARSLQIIQRPSRSSNFITQIPLQRKPSLADGYQPALEIDVVRGLPQDAICDLYDTSHGVRD
ncbi:hypothetical protein F4860DRAFT_20366 [Xylaria cubensis]|nr:hypothetical protein F4860DRAFT_20366 [Xylaria cubensis]